MHYNLFTITIIAIALLVINLILAGIMIVAARRSAKSNRRMLENMQLQNRYMDNTGDFCYQTDEMIDSIERAISDGQVAENNQAFLEKCGDLLTYMHGGDSAVEAVIADKKALCNDLSIKFDDKIRSLPEEGQLDEMDIVSILGNLLDNAIEGATASSGDGKYVNCESRIERNVWFLTINNSKDSRLHLRDNQFPTTKADATNHGMGTRIVRNAVSKYHGQIKFNDSGDEFVVTVRIVLKKE